MERHRIRLTGSEFGQIGGLMYRASVSVVLLSLVGATTQPSTRPITANDSIHVEWLVIATPDEEGRKLGLTAFATTVWFADGHLRDSLFHFRGGCIQGGYPPAKATWFPDKSFSAHCEYKEGDGVSRISWTGMLSKNRLNGELTLAIAGPLRSVQEIERLLEPARDRFEREPRQRDARGQLVNGAVIESLKRDVELGRMAYAAPGRTLRFTFETQAMNIDAWGSWVRPPSTSQPTR